MFQIHALLAAGDEATSSPAAVIPLTTKGSAQHRGRVGHHRSGSRPRQGLDTLGGPADLLDDAGAVREEDVPPGLGDRGRRAGQPDLVAVEVEHAADAVGDRRRRSLREGGEGLPQHG